MNKSKEELKAELFELETAYKQVKNEGAGFNYDEFYKAVNREAVLVESETPFSNFYSYYEEDKKYFAKLTLFQQYCVLKVMIEHTRKKLEKLNKVEREKSLLNNKMN